MGTWILWELLETAAALSKLHATVYRYLCWLVVLVSVCVCVCVCFAEVLLCRSETCNQFVALRCEAKAEVDIVQV